MCPIFPIQGPEILTKLRGHEFHNSGRGLYAHHNHYIHLSPTRRKFFEIKYIFTMYVHISPAQGPESLT